MISFSTTSSRGRGSNQICCRPPAAVWTRVTRAPNSVPIARATATTLSVPSAKGAVWPPTKSAMARSTAWTARTSRMPRVRRTIALAEGFGRDAPAGSAARTTSRCVTEYLGTGSLVGISFSYSLPPFPGFCRNFQISEKAARPLKRNFLMHLVASFVFVFSGFWAGRSPRKVYVGYGSLSFCSLLEFQPAFPVSLCLFEKAF